ncbi:MAG TPA: hypothetical protein VFW43_05285 [Polaromonas sp.]|nr:hypothetical protein [Polaromonas sp.]
MPRFNATSSNSDSRKDLEQRARQAAMPVAPQRKGRWPFLVADTAPLPSDQEAGPPMSPEQYGKWRE